jgi:hypothetical protein
MVKIKCVETQLFLIPYMMLRILAIAKYTNTLLPGERVGTYRPSLA